jgi:hypothetical protein
LSTNVIARLLMMEVLIDDAVAEECGEVGIS